MCVLLIQHITMYIINCNSNIRFYNEPFELLGRFLCCTSGEFVQWARLSDEPLVASLVPLSLKEWPHLRRHALVIRVQPHNLQQELHCNTASHASCSKSYTATQQATPPAARVTLQHSAQFSLGNVGT